MCRSAGTALRGGVLGQVQRRSGRFVPERAAVPEGVLEYVGDGTGGQAQALGRDVPEVSDHQVVNCTISIFTGLLH